MKHGQCHCERIEESGGAGIKIIKSTPLIFGIAGSDQTLQQRNSAEISIYCVFN
jgi:hypothetical protein